MSRSRTDRSGRTAILGCGTAVLLLLGLCGLGVLAYAGVVLAVHLSPGYQSTVAAIQEHEQHQPLLGEPVRSGIWLGLQLARDDLGTLELRVHSHAVGAHDTATVYATLQDSADGWTPTSILLDLDGNVVDVLQANAESEVALDHERRDTFLTEARALLADERPAEALPLADQAVTLDPDNPDAWALRSRARLALSDTKGAEADAREALNLSPEHAEGLVALASALRATEDWDACIDTATMRIRAAPRDGAAWTVRSHCYLGLEKPREALAGAREACNRGDPEGCELARSLE
jgi:tetratricopeptide (TPR) repeat protein